MEFLDANKGRYFSSKEIYNTLTNKPLVTIKNNLRRIIQREEYELLIVPDEHSYCGLGHYYRAKPETEEK